MRNEKLRKVLTLHAYDLMWARGSFNVSTGGHIREHHNTLTNIAKPRKFRSTSGTGGTRRYWWLCLIDFWNFSTMCVFEITESNANIPTELPFLGSLENTGQLPVQQVLEGTAVIVFYRFSQFLHYLCFRGQRIHFWHYWWATMFDKSR